jgi:hypothetical protein
VCSRCRHVSALQRVMIVLGYRRSGVFLWLPEGDVRTISQLQWLPEGDANLCVAPSCCLDWSRRG